MPVIGTTLNQRFLLETELGRGGMGAVFRATDQILQRPVAIKVLRDLSGEDVGRRLRLEAQITARLLHENIVRLYDFGQDGATYFFVMEEVDGAGFQRRWRQLPLTAVMAILAQVAEALDYAHRRGVIHRDVKPANILLTRADQPKLSDFGLSLLGEATTQESGLVRGTPHYMSPEQARGLRIDHRSDLYALGVILYECATGTLPFQGPLVSILSQQVNAAPVPPRTRKLDVSPALEALILALMAKEPEKRPGSGREVAEQLRALAPVVAASGAVNPYAPTVTAAIAPPGGSAPPSSRGSGTVLRPATAAPTGVAPVSAGGARRPPGSVEVRDILEVVEAEPVELSPEERYLCGHYLSYLLGGSRRRGFWLRRPLDPLNADRARLLLAMAYLMTGERRRGAAAARRRAARSPSRCAARAQPGGGGQVPGQP